MIAFRDRAILRFFLYSGARIGTASRLRVSDFHVDGEEATVRLKEKGKKTRTTGLHFGAAEASQVGRDVVSSATPGVTWSLHAGG